MTLVERNFVHQISSQLIKQNFDDALLMISNVRVDMMVGYFAHIVFSSVFARIS